MNYITEELFYSGDSVACFKEGLDMIEGLENLMLLLLVGLILILFCGVAGRLCYVARHSFDEELHAIDASCSHCTVDNSHSAESFN